MKIVFITPGSGDGYYCGNCFRDNLQAQALLRAGHDVIVVPLYLPLKYIGTLQGNAPLSFPATTYYVEQKIVGRPVASWLKRMLGAPSLLRLAAGMSGTTSASGMEEMTLDMIQGDSTVFDGHLQQLASWLETECPDIIQLSSTLVLGVAKGLKERLSIPIVCSLQDEEVWIDSLDAPTAARAWRSIAENSVYIDRFITTSRFYRDQMRLRLPTLPIAEVIYPGIETGRYATSEWPKDPTIGFFYRMNRLDGLDILAEAFVLLKQRGTVPRLKLRIGGGYMQPDKAFLREVKRTLHPYLSDVTFEENYSWEHHADFYRKITVLSVPLRFTESVGIYLCEAFAAGRPAVEPATGSFPEILGDAGIAYSPNNAHTLADALEKLLTDPGCLSTCSANARHLSKNRYNDELTASQLLHVYRDLRN